MLAAAWVVSLCAFELAGLHLVITAITTKAAACVLSLCAITLAGLHLAITTVATLQAAFSPLESATFAPR